MSIRRLLTVYIDCTFLQTTKVNEHIDICVIFVSFEKVLSNCILYQDENVLQ